MADLVVSSPRMACEFSMRSGPAWRSSVELDTVDKELRREMEARPEGSIR